MKNKIVFQFIVLIIFGFLTFLAADKVYAQDAEQPFPYKDTFVISGYYSPLPAQTRYVTGTYEGDLRLNGNGVVGADGTPVYPGMLAAPPNMPFGTKIEIPGIGMTAVHDRGGAIKNKRLDIWMGHGEIGMRRALAWGLRSVEVTVYGTNDTLEEQVFLDALPLARDVGLLVRTRYFRVDIGYGDQTDGVKELQRFLKKTGFYNDSITGFYGDETRAAVLAFQLQENIIPDMSDSGAGHFGPRTRALFEAYFEKKKVEIKNRIPKNSLKPGDTGEEVRALQGILVELGLLHDVTGVYDEITAHAVFEFQKQHQVLQSEFESGAGFFGGRTRAILLAVIDSEYTPDINKLPIPEHNTVVIQKPKSVFTVALKRGDKNESVKRLQEELRRIEFLRIEPTGYFGVVTEHALFKFQQSVGIVKTKNDLGAGYFGPKTRERFNTLVAAREEQTRLIAQAGSQARAAIAKKDLMLGERGDDVRQLQLALQKLGYFKGNLVSNYFGDVTRESLITFQLQYGVIASEKDANAGVLNAATRKTLDAIVKG